MRVLWNINCERGRARVRGRKKRGGAFKRLQVSIFIVLLITLHTLSAAHHTTLMNQGTQNYFLVECVFSSFFSFWAFSRFFMKNRKIFDLVLSAVASTFLSLTLSRARRICSSRGSEQKDGVSTAMLNYDKWDKLEVSDDEDD